MLKPFHTSTAVAPATFPLAHYQVFLSSPLKGGNHTRLRNELCNCCAALQPIRRQIHTFANGQVGQYSTSDNVERIESTNIEGRQAGIFINVTTSGKVGPKPG